MGGAKVKKNYNKKSRQSVSPGRSAGEYRLKYYYRLYVRGIPFCLRLDTRLDTNEPKYIAVRKSDVTRTKNKSVREMGKWCTGSIPRSLFLPAGFAPLHNETAAARSTEENNHGRHPISRLITGLVFIDSLLLAYLNYRGLEC